MKTIFLIMALSLTAMAQRPDVLDDYGPHPVDKRATVRLHLALKLTTGKWNADQRADILQAFNSPTSVREDDLYRDFTLIEATDVFYRLGTVDLGDYRRIFRAVTRQEKKEIYGSLSIDQQALMWQENLAYRLAVMDGVSHEQQAFVADMAAAMPLTQQTVGPWEERLLVLFPDRAMRRAFFAVIGEAGCVGVNTTALVGRRPMLPTCVCTTHSYNYSCNNDCGNAGSCAVDPGNCGVLWLWDCNGMCDNSEMGMQ